MCLVVWYLFDLDCFAFDCLLWFVLLASVWICYIAVFTCWLLLFCFGTFPGCCLDAVYLMFILLVVCMGFVCLPGCLVCYIVRCFGLVYLLICWFVVVYDTCCLRACGLLFIACV